MAATFSDIGNIAADANFQKRVGYALMVAAVNVYSESPGTQAHPARVALAIRVLNGAFGNSTAAIAVMTNATIAAEANFLTVPAFAVPDADIQFAINSLWNALAGA